MNKLLVVTLAAASFVLVACGRDTPDNDAATVPSTPPQPDETSSMILPSPIADASVTLSPTEGHQTAGRILFTRENNGVRIRGEVTGLMPSSDHGFHIHENGDCTAPDASSAGEHFNPGGQPHGNPAAEAHHSGDLLNLQAGAGGIARLDIFAPGLMIGGDSASNVLGKAVIVHELTDDYSSQPAGNSGKRIACGVVK